MFDVLTRDEAGSASSCANAPLRAVKRGSPPAGAVSNKTTSDRMVSGVSFRRPTRHNGNCDAGRGLTLRRWAAGAAALAGFSRVSIHRLLLRLCFTCMNLVFSQRSELHGQNTGETPLSIHPLLVYGRVLVQIHQRQMQ